MPKKHDSQTSSQNSSSSLASEKTLLEPKKTNLLDSSSTAIAKEEDKETSPFIPKPSSQDSPLPHKQVISSEISGKKILFATSGVGSKEELSDHPLSNDELLATIGADLEELEEAKTLLAVPPNDTSFSSEEWHPPSENWERYRLEEKLGEGGMGIVFKAYDRELHRYVALKFIIEDNPKLAKRLAWEAQAQARIQHENVCKVYDVGEYKGRAYIAMQYISGQTLDVAQKHLTTREKVELIRISALAIHAAHQEGVIHRDLKPTNIMVHEENGHYKPYILDFGLAREVSMQGSTATNALVGTPHFMSPEQMRGQTHLLDRHTDIYSLGATLYAIIAGRPPFPTTGMDILFKVLHEEPLPLRKVNPNIPQDLETIVMKCLEKEPERRYDSAEALAQDLERLLNDEPIAARRATLFYRIKKFVKKNKRLTFVSAIAFLLVVAFAIFGIMGQINANKRAQLAHRFGQEVKELENIMRYAYMMPLHDVTPQKRLVSQRLNKIQKELKHLNPFHRAPGYHALALGSMALLQYKKAEKYLRKAWLWYKTPEVAEALGIVWSHLYQSELHKLEQLPESQRRRWRRFTIEWRYRRKALKYLNESRKLARERSSLLEARIAYYNKKWNKVIKLAQEELQKKPWRYEAIYLQAQVYSQQGRALANSGQFRQATHFAQKAAQLFKKALNIARSDPFLYGALCNEETFIMKLKFYSEQGIRRSAQAALQACRHGLKADPHRIELYEYLAHFFRKRAQFEMYAGRSPVALIKNAIKTSRKALQLIPKHAAIYITLGHAYYTLAEYELFRRQDPSTPTAKAIRYYQKALKYGYASFSKLYSALGVMYWIKAHYLMQRDEDNEAFIQRGLLILKKAIKLNPKDSDAYYNSALLWFTRAKTTFRRGLSPLTALKKSYQLYQKALSIDPNDAFIHNGLGYATLLEASYAFAHGKNPLPLARKALQYFQKARNKNPALPFTYNGLGHLAELKARYHRIHGKSPRPFIERAIHWFQRGVEYKEDYVDLYLGVAAIYIQGALYSLSQKRSPADELNKIEDVLVDTTQINPHLNELQHLIAQQQIIYARWLVSLGRSPHRALEKAEHAILKAKKLSPKRIAIYITAANLYRWKALWAFYSSLQQEAHLAIKLGLQHLKKAQQLSHDNARILALKGIFYFLLAKYDLKRDYARQNALIAQKLITRALTMNKNLTFDFQHFLPQIKKLLTTQ